MTKFAVQFVKDFSQDFSLYVGDDGIAVWDTYYLSRGAVRASGSSLCDEPLEEAENILHCKAAISQAPRFQSRTEASASRLAQIRKDFGGALMALSQEFLILSLTLEEGEVNVTKLSLTGKPTPFDFSQLGPEKRIIPRFKATLENLPGKSEALIVIDGAKGYFIDLPYFNGTDLRSLAGAERFALLQMLFPDYATAIRVLESSKGQSIEEFAQQAYIEGGRLLLLPQFGQGGQRGNIGLYETKPYATLPFRVLAKSPVDTAIQLGAIEGGDEISCGTIPVPPDMYEKIPLDGIVETRIKDPLTATPRPLPLTEGIVCHFEDDGTPATLEQLTT